MFCDAPGPLTQEHVLPRWVLELLGTSRRVRAKPSADLGEEGWTELGFALIARRLCDGCNDKWLGRRLETRVKSVLGGMIRGETTILAPADQIRLATWAVKTVLLMTLVDPFGRTFRDEDFKEFRRRMLPNENTWVLLSAYGDTTYNHHYQRTELHLPDPVLRRHPSEANGYVVTFSVGCVVFQVVGHHTEYDLLIADGRPVDEATHRLWPPADEPRPVRWPFSRHLGDESLAQMHAAVGRPGVRTVLPLLIERAAGQT